MDMETVRIIARTLVALTAIPAVLSVVVHLRTPWRHTVLGKHLLAYMGVFAVVLTLTIVSWFVRGSLGFLIAYTVAFIGMPIVMWWRLILQWQALREGRRNGTE